VISLMHSFQFICAPIDCYCTLLLLYEISQIKCK